jgi:uncharacterized membrane protein YozB (DUF420 family)
MSIYTILHFAFMSLAVICILTGAIIAHSRKQNWLKKHKSFAITGVICSLIAFGSIFFFKVSMQFPHFHSPHAIGGAVTLLLLIATPTLGALIPKGPKGLRAAHKLLGRITSAAILLVAVSGVLRLLQITRN